MNQLINIKNENGHQTVSARELYLGLGLDKSNWSRWYPTNIMANEFFKRDYDWVRLNDEGNETIDFEITVDFAKHIAMMSKAKKSHEYRNYFLICEKQAKDVQPQLSKEVQAIFVLDERTVKIENRMNKFEDNMPLFNVECKELQALVRKIGIKALGGYKTPAYNDNSVRTKIYKDIQHQLKREFGIERYEGIKRVQLDAAKAIVNDYKVPMFLVKEIEIINDQIRF